MQIAGVQNALHCRRDAILRPAVRSRVPLRRPGAITRPRGQLRLTMHRRPVGFRRLAVDAGFCLPSGLLLRVSMSSRISPRPTQRGAFLNRGTAPSRLRLTDSSLSTRLALQNRTQNPGSPSTVPPPEKNKQTNRAARPSAEGRGPILSTASTGSSLAARGTPMQGRRYKPRLRQRT